MEFLNIDEYIKLSNKIERWVGIIVEAERIDSKYIKLKVNFGKDIFRTVITNVGKEIPANYDLIGIKTFFILNVRPFMIKEINMVSEAILVPVFNFKGEIEFNDYSIGSKVM